MENIFEQWNRCLELMRQQLAKQQMGDHIFDVWFSRITCEGYDAQANLLTLRVPSIYVAEYLEQYHVRLLGWAIQNSFQKATRLQYRIPKNADGQPTDYLKKAEGHIPHFQIPDAANRLRTELHRQLGNDCRWLPAYDEVAAWLSDNKGRGLLCVGTSGLGKTVICQRVLPAIFQRTIPAVTSREMNTRIDELLHERVVIVDDLGKEDVEVKNYGNRRTPFFELCDAAEKEGHLLIITTNLATTPSSDPLYHNSIEQRYGREVVSRLRATTHVVEFIGKDMRA